MKKGQISSAIAQIQDILAKLDNEQERLKDALTNLASENKEDYNKYSESLHESVCASEGFRPYSYYSNQ